MTNSNNEIAISIKDLVIRYKNIKKISFKKGTLGKNRNAKFFEAIRGVSIDVKKGEILGICGKNGSGKSTILRAIAGIFSADEGTIELYNQTISLLSIGVGFQKRLSGLDNIYLSGMLLGFTQEEIDAKVDEIIEFSELKDFIYKPVTSYSSGMYSKLAFSITAILETDIMLIDEVLSVGDIHFAKKSYDKMKELITDENRTVVIVSHSTKTITELCSRVIWLHDGKIRMDGNPEEIMGKYEDFMNNEP